MNKTHSTHTVFYTCARCGSVERYVYDTADYPENTEDKTTVSSCENCIDSPTFYDYSQYD